jgi:hypothetical protein
MISLYTWATDRYDAFKQLEQDLQSNLSIKAWVRCQRHPFPIHFFIPDELTSKYKLHKITINVELADA